MPDGSMFFLALVLASFAVALCVGTVAAVLVSAFRRSH
jgi:hypothetical protein